MNSTHMRMLAQVHGRIDFLTASRVWDRVWGPVAMCVYDRVEVVVHRRMRAEGDR